MLPNNKEELKKAKFLETARAAYPGGMSMYGNGIVEAGNKKVVSLFFISNSFSIPRFENFQQDHAEICKLLSKVILLNPKRKKLKEETVAAKFLDTFLYQLMKFEEYRNLWPKLHLIIDDRILKKLKQLKDEDLLQFLKSFPKSAYEADYSQYLGLQEKIQQFLEYTNSDFFRNKIDLNFLWAQ